MLRSVRAAPVGGWFRGHPAILASVPSGTAPPPWCREPSPDPPRRAARSGDVSTHGGRARRDSGDSGGVVSPVETETPGNRSRASCLRLRRGGVSSRAMPCEWFARPALRVSARDGVPLPSILLRRAHACTSRRGTIRPRAGPSPPLDTPGRQSRGHAVSRTRTDPPWRAVCPLSIAWCYSPFRRLNRCTVPTIPTRASFAHHAFASRRVGKNRREPSRVRISHGRLRQFNCMCQCPPAGACESSRGIPAQRRGRADRRLRATLPRAPTQSRTVANRSELPVSSCRVSRVRCRVSVFKILQSVAVRPKACKVLRLSFALD